MKMSEEENLKQKKLEELQEKMKKQQETQQQEYERESQMQSMLKRYLDEEARQRLNNVKLVNKELYTKAFKAIMMMMQRGYVQGKLNEVQVKEILMNLKEDREFKITRK